MLLPSVPWYSGDAISVFFREGVGEMVGEGARSCLRGFFNGDPNSIATVVLSFPWYRCDCIYVSSMLSI